MNRFEDEEFPPAGNSPARKQKTFEDLTLAQALSYLVLRPRAAARQLWRVLTYDPDAVVMDEPDVIDWPDDDQEPPADAADDDWPGEYDSPGDSLTPPADMDRWVRIGSLAVAVLLALRGGHLLQRAALDPLRHAQGDTGGSLWWFLLAGVVLIGAEVWLSRDWWVARFAPELSGDSEEFTSPPALLSTRGEGEPADGLPVPPVQGGLRTEVIQPLLSSSQLVLMPLALLLSALTYALNVRRDPVTHDVIDVVITGGGLLVWIASVILWIVIVTGIDTRRLWGGIEALAWGRVVWPRFRRSRPGWAVLVALAGVVALGAGFRLHDLASTPPEMTSDHIEKLRDAVRVDEGYYAVFFPNNGGREGFQMGVVALVAKLPGVGFTFDALKLATVIEGVITLPALWWMARQIVGTDTDERRRLGNWTGIALAGLAAIGMWHVMLSRLGLRIVLTPLTTALALGFLARAMRHNRIGDYAALGLVLGAGVYFYQANRMLPLVALAGIGLALFSRVRTLRGGASMLGNVIGFAAAVLTPIAAVALLARVFEEHEGGWQDIGAALSAFLPLIMMTWFSLVSLAARTRHNDPLLQYGGGLLAAAVIALALYIPMGHYAEINPDQFWNRTRGRLFGEQAFVRADPDSGQLVAYEPTLREQAERFWDQRDVLLDNYWDALRMFHWRGDGAWISNPHNAPALDGAAGGLLFLGLVAWGVLVIRRRDPALGLLPVVVLIMLLPSAMTVAYTIENPSFTRASGTLPGVLMLAALPVGMLCGQVTRLDGRAARVPAGRIGALAIVGGLLWYGIGWNWDTFFTDYPLNYTYSWKPYHAIAQPLREFVEGDGSFGNAFVVATPHWLDHRILGAAAGDLRWPNGLAERDDLIPAIRRNMGTRYAYDPGKPLFIMYHVEDTETPAYLDSLFPGGEHSLYEYTYEALEPGYYLHGSFYIFRVNAGDIPLQ